MLSPLLRATVRCSGLLPGRTDRFMRTQEYLRKSYKNILHSVGIILIVSSGITVLPLMLLPFRPEEAANSPVFLVSAGFLLLSGLLLRNATGGGASSSLSVNEGGVSVVVAWIIVMAVSAFPVKVIAETDYSRALFESVSGWTTTGLSVIDVDSASSLLLLWRSIIQLFGGAGLAIIMISASAGNTSGIGISSAEGRVDQVAPHVKKSARLVFSMYLIYALLGAVAFYIGGMSVFDAINHSFTAVSTGGFSTHSSSFGYWDSPYLEAIALPLMILGSLSFITAWMLWHGKFRSVARNGEVKLMSVVVPLSVAGLFLLTSLSLYPTVGKSARVAVFEVLSALTTTGFSSVGYSDWPPTGILILVILMLIGGGTYSTAGGLKQYRIYMVCRHLVWQLKSYLRPSSQIIVRTTSEAGIETPVHKEKMYQIFAFISLYIFLYLAGVIHLCSLGYSVRDSLFEFASSIGTVGLSIGVTASDMPDSALYMSILAMFLGRLEFMIVIVSVLKVIGDLKQLITRQK